MVKNKSTAPTPEDQEMMHRTGEDLHDGYAAGENADDQIGAYPIEEAMDLMEREHGGFVRDGILSEASGMDEPAVSVTGHSDSFQEDYGALLRELSTAEPVVSEADPMPVSAAETEESGKRISARTIPGEVQPERETEKADAQENERSVPGSDRKERASTVDAAARRRERVLTIDARDEIPTNEEREAIIWHDIQNAYHTHRILTGMLDGVEKTKSGMTIAVVSYKGLRVAIPLKEMLLYTEDTSVLPHHKLMNLMDQVNRILHARLGSEVDFVVKGYDNEDRSAVGSRKEAMYRKRQTFYLDTDEMGEHLIYEGRVVQARVVGVAEKVIRVEVFGVEASIVARGLSWEWIGDARDYFSVGDRILVRVLKINGSNQEDLSIRVDVRSVSTTNNRDNLRKCMPQCRYMGRVTDVRNGVVFIRLNNGVNAIAHSCYDSRHPGKKDDVSFAVTRLDEERGVAIGIITRIIKQNI